MDREPESAGSQPAEPIEEDDAEGHSLLLDPMVARDLARGRTADVERDSRVRQIRKSLGGLGGGRRRDERR